MIIGFGLFNCVGIFGVYGVLFGKEESKLIKEVYVWMYEEDFYVLLEVYEYFVVVVKELGEKKE